MAFPIGGAFAYRGHLSVGQRPLAPIHRIPEEKLARARNGARRVGDLLFRRFGD